MTIHNLRRVYYAGIVIGIFSCSSGCQEANVAIDFIVGRQSPALSSADEFERPPIILAARRSVGEASAPAPTAGPTPSTDKTPAVSPAPQQGKRRAPGILPPGATPERAEERRGRDVFAIERDPFRPPTEILPTECPPSMPLCRFDRSQLKLVGVIQVGDGQYKAMVEDPDGRGYFVTTGMQIYGATVTQVSNRGITLHVHKTQQDVVMPLTKELREPSEM